jgi:hypothetical protein
VAAALLATALTLWSCAATSTGPGLDDADVRVLFIGNSLTYGHDVPGLVQALALADGRSMAHAELTMPDASLEDHWHAGAAARIRRLKPDIVVLQQGPSSLPESRVHLVQWTETFAAVIREAGGEPALYMVWPSTTRRFAFPDVMESYAAAASAVGGRLLPAGATWVEAWKLDSSLEFHAADGVHATYLGALAAAQTIYTVLFDADPAALPRLNDGVSEAVLEILSDAVAAGVAAWEAGS